MVELTQITEIREEEDYATGRSAVGRENRRKMAVKSSDNVTVVKGNVSKITC